MKFLRRYRFARWLVLSVAMITLVFLPPLGAACACTDCGPSEVAACCSTAETAGCCCTAATCCAPKPAAEGCCVSSESNGGCECTAVPASREPAPLPASDSTANEVTAVTTLQADWQLPPVIPVVADGCYEADFGPPPRAVSVQIAFCIWRN